MTQKGKDQKRREKKVCQGGKSLALLPRNQPICEPCLDSGRQGWMEGWKTGEAFDGITQTVAGRNPRRESRGKARVR